MPLNQLRAVPKSEAERLKRLTEIEKTVRSKGFCTIAGIDEAGRGPLAGPVVAASCIIKEGIYFPGINDSKLLTARAREKLFEELTAHDQVCYGVGVVEPAVIDQINILQATLQAMRESVQKLFCPPDYLLVDGVNLEFGSIVSQKVIKGDSRCQVIASASVIAKQSRDKIMLRYHEMYPEYGFDQHKGYGTAKHLAALKRYGPCPIHRFSFAPVSRASEKGTRALL